LVHGKQFSNQEAEQILQEVLGRFVVDKKSPLSSQAYHFLRDEVIHMNLPPGLPLVEAKISSTLGVSRTPVREALRRLANENLVDVFPQSGNFVAPIKVIMVENAVFARTTLETANINTLAREITAQELMALQHNVQKQELAVKESDYKTFHDMDETMHRMLFKLCGREQVWEWIMMLKAHLDRARILTLPYVGMADRAYEDHRLIVDALERGDSELAQQRMQDHLDSLTNILQRCEKEIADYLDQ
jgi:DNA-binding GntR family transcriptional regulator